MAKTSKKKRYLAPGHNACPGCAVPIGVQAILEAVGEDVIVVSPTGCLETFTSPYGFSAWEVPWVHSIFENAPAVASGVKAALRYTENSDTEVVVIGGDGASYDIGMGSLSGMFERDEKILYVCYDNEAYMNTGIQRSGATPFAASTTTTPSGTISFGEKQKKKNLMNIALAHGLRYVASASVAYVNDLKKKVKAALDNDGASFIELMTPCNLGWGMEPHEAIEVARLAVDTGLFPLVEFTDGQLTKVRKIKEVKPVGEYLGKQARFKHLFDEKWQDVLKEVQDIADENIARFGLTD
ncbi:MAG: thiamine pyrophosphate-dependent enzyme [Halanaerobium sp.]|nr:thiamine pyrophosphate-dependent enzyme [Halanaerobium sp.]